MNKIKFRIDLGQGDSIDVTLEKEHGYSLSHFIDEIAKGKEWIVINDTAIQKTHIKRIVVL